MKHDSNLRRSLQWLWLLATVALSGCSLPVRQHAVPQAWSEKAEVVGLPGVRYVVRAEMPEVVREGIDSIKKEQAYLAAQGQLNGNSLPPANFLALSGGGDDGAFGAGLLCGLTVAGNRPEFKMVTGISTGALIAPFAFLGPKHDEQLKIVRDRHLYVIRNARLDPDWAEVERQTISIAGRAISSLIQTQGIGDLYRIYATAQRDGIDYNLAYIPKTFYAPHKEDFDTDYIRKLFQTGYDLAAKGYRWEKTPPGL
jgi:hypothetical protein